MNWPDTFEIPFRTETVIGVALMALVTLAMPLIFGIFRAQIPPQNRNKSLRRRLGLEQINPGLLLLATTFWLFLFLHLYLGLLWTIWDVWSDDLPSTNEEWRDWRFTLTKLTAVTAVLGAVVAFPVTMVRLGLTRRQARHAEDALYNEKINEAARSLYATRVITRSFQAVGERPIAQDIHEDDIVRRNAAIDTLEGLANERPDEAVRISRMLSVYVRELSREYPAEEVPEGLEPHEIRHRVRSVPAARSDRYSAVLALGRMRKKHSEQFAKQLIDLRGANLQGMNLSAGALSFANFLLGEASLQGCSFRQADLRGCFLEKADMRGADLVKTDLNGAMLALANLQGVFLSGAELQDADLRLTNLKGAELTLAKLHNALLEGADMQNIIARNSELFCSDMRSVKLQKADLRWAKMQGADLSKAEFDEDTKLLNADMRFCGAKWVNFEKAEITQAQLNSLFADQTVDLPSWFTEPTHWKETDQSNIQSFYNEWRAWQTKHGFDPDDPSTWPDH